MAKRAHVGGFKDREVHLDKGLGSLAPCSAFPSPLRVGRKSGMVVTKLRKDPSPPPIFAALQAKGFGCWRLQEGGRTGYGGHPLYTQT